MKFGVQVRATAEGVDLTWIARELEWHGIESLFLPEHTHVPLASRSAHPGGETLMEPAKRGFDPFIGLAFAAAATSKLRIGTGVCLLPQHDPIVLAKEVSTLDVLSGGRLILGVGAGWAREEMANHGVDPARRWDVLREKVLALKAIWTQEAAEFQGEHVAFDPIWQWPKPRQRPHPPVLIGSDGAGALERVLAFGDGWIPNFDSSTPARARELQRMAAETGRGRLPVTAYAAPVDADAVAECVSAGIERVVFTLPAADLGEMEPALDRIAAVMARFAEETSSAA